MYVRINWKTKISLSFLLIKHIQKLAQDTAI